MAFFKASRHAGCVFPLRAAHLQRGYLESFQDLFRFEDADDVRHLMRVMEFPDTWEVPEGKFTAEEAMSLFLRRMAYPCRFVELQGEMRAQRSALSSLFLAVTDWMYDKWTLPLLNSGMTKWRHRAQLYADAIDWQTSANQVEWGNIIGFVDGTARRIVRVRRVR